MCSSFLAIVDVTEFHTGEAYKSLGLTRVKYSVNNLSKSRKGISYSAYEAQYPYRLGENTVCVHGN
jgi:hypothetical protein